MQIDGGKVIGERAANTAAKLIEDNLWRLGGSATAEKVLRKLVARPLNRTVLASSSAASSSSSSSSPSSSDELAEQEILVAAKAFLKDMMTTKGRRSDIDANAFWAAATALVPDDAFHNRRGRAVMRLLNLIYRALKKASDLRSSMQDSGRGWKYIHTAPHQDCVDWSP